MFSLADLRCGVAPHLTSPFWLTLRAFDRPRACVVRPPARPRERHQSSRGEAAIRVRLVLPAVWWGCRHLAGRLSRGWRLLTPTTGGFGPLWSVPWEIGLNSTNTGDKSAPDAAKYSSDATHPTRPMPPADLLSLARSPCSLHITLCLSCRHLVRRRVESLPCCTVVARPQRRRQRLDSTSVRL